MPVKTSLILAAFLIEVYLLVVTTGAAACVYTRQDFPFECGDDLPCHYIQHHNLCVLGGCRDCIQGCGTGTCNCGGNTYDNDCLVPCDASPEPIVDPSSAEIASLIAVPDCRGFYRLAAARTPRQPKNLPDLDRIQIPPK